MGSLTLSEIVFIAVVVLIVFGPQRLPELARKAGTFVSKARRAARSFTDELKGEYGETIEPLRDLRQEVRGIQQDLRGTVKAIDDATRDVTRLPPSGEAAGGGAVTPLPTNDADTTTPEEPEATGTA